ncbi:hypothetical protein BDN72DRAFT_872706 [Pluteus cervinus]|uniref:Uncharacterized protein n=1 Tax=Pluteus cervinus TaxID=181527 RepID=A0ACD3A7J8_9AGAR|nr:hypothetical protein BDN72DRAFT_872706 [Pluteus cervinus]
MYHCKDCFYKRPLCKDCIKHEHVNHPFHRIRKWEGTHFSACSLEALEMELYLGHGGTRCPNLSARGGYKARRFTLVHTNGIHQMAVHFCQCLNHLDEPYQLLRAQLFPPTLERPKTVFTFEFLDDFHVHSLTSKKSMYDYLDAVQRKTDAVFPDDVADRYKEAHRADRVWRYLALVRRSGQAHGIDDHLTHRRPNSLAVRCPACPEPGFNLDQTVLDLAKPSDMHKYTYFICMDGNYRLQQSFKTSQNSDPNDVALNNGNAYFVNDAIYKKYLKLVGLDDSVEFFNTPGSEPLYN